MHTYMHACTHVHATILAAQCQESVATFMIWHTLLSLIPLTPGQQLNDRLSGFKMGRIIDTHNAVHVCVGWGGA